LASPHLGGIQQRARTELERILAVHQPQALEERQREELQAVLTAAERDLTR
jgi:hypothetical protein